MDDIYSLLPSTEQDELLILRYVCKYPNVLYILSDSYFNNKSNKQIFSIIKTLYEKNNIEQITQNIFNSVYTEYKQQIDIIFQQKIITIDEFNILKNKLYEQSIKRKILLYVNDFLNQTLTVQTDYKQVQQLADSILYSTIQLSNEDEILKSFDILTQDYLQIIEKREKGLGKKTYGYSSIDTLLVRPASAGEMTTLFGMKGSGKSLFAKCIEMMLVNKGVCVISFNLEMTEESNLDRLLSIETNLPLQEIIELQNEESKQLLIQKLQSQKQRKNYLFYSEPTISLNELDLCIYKAKQYFKEHNVLPDDGYCFVTIDLTEQIEELSGKAGTELKPGVNKLLQIAKKHNVHILNVLQSNENLFRAGKMFSQPEQCDTFTLQPEHVEGGSVYAARSRIVMAINRPLLLKKRFFPNRNEEWDLEVDKLIVRIIKQNDSPKLGQAVFVFGDNSFRLYPYKEKK